MNREKLKTQDIVVLVLAVLTVAACILVLIPNFSGRNDMATITTPEPTVEPTPLVETTPEPTATPEPTPEPTPAPDPNEELSRAMMEAMNVEERVWQLFLASPEAITGVEPVTISGDGMAAALEAYPVGGLVYDRRNVEDEEQVTDMLAGAQNRAETALFILYNDDGGDSPLSLEGEMQTFGFNLSLGQRETGLLYAAEYHDGMETGDLAAVWLGEEYVTISAGEGAESESYESSSAETEDIPLFLSGEHLSALRESGWNGVIFTPYLSAGVDGYSAGELAVAALEAGCDVLCLPDDLDEAGQAVIDAINNGTLELGRINESVQRILFAKLEAGILSPTAESTDSASDAQSVEETGE